MKAQEVAAKITPEIKLKIEEIVGEAYDRTARHYGGVQTRAVWTAGERRF